MPNDSRSDRRKFLRFGAAAGSILTACKTTKLEEQSEPSSLGKPLSPYGERSPFEKSVRYSNAGKNPEIGSTRTPLQDSYGIITPSSLHFERHHSGVPSIDPAAHRLLLHGMVARPLLLTMADIHRLPAVSRIYFLECSGNSSSEWGPKTAPDAQKAHGLASCSEW